MIEDFWEAYTSSEKETFQRACRRLLKNTFVVRDKDVDSKKIYYFISKRSEPFSEYFKYIGFDILVDRENGVVMLQNDKTVSETRRIQANRRQFRKIESIVLCCLWTLYSDRIATGSLKKNITVSITDLRFELEKYGLKEQVDNKSLISSVLDMLKKYNLVDIDGKIGEVDCLIIIYPSIQFALNVEEFKSFIEKAKERFVSSDIKDEIEQEEDDDYDE